MALRAVGIVCALASEARHLGPAKPLAPLISGTDAPALGALADGTLIVVSGMGAGAAARGANRLVQAGAAALASWGMVGGLDPALQPGTLVLPAQVQASSGSTLATDASWRERLRRMLSGRVPVNEGLLFTSAVAIGTVVDKAELFDRTGAVAVDMESAAIGAVARQHGLPFIAVRVVVDTAADSLPPVISAAADREGHLQIGRLIGALALSPSNLAPLVRLARRYHVANRALAAVARLGPLHP